MGDQVAKYIEKDVKKLYTYLKRNEPSLASQLRRMIMQGAARQLGRRLVDDVLDELDDYARSHHVTASDLEDLDIDVDVDGGDVDIDWDFDISDLFY
ncbi:hypothetical protein [Streptomyces coerulescens]|jgi:hypothetical protein|uniref:Uncharacterized protein n=1 Tax=Streptomyces coerulescens TaxID=29304 RepID=A0ABW0CXK0_STRCD